MNNKNNKLKLRIIYILVVFYSVYDIMNSASAGNATDDRSKVYVFLFAIVTCLGVFCLFSNSFPNMAVIISQIIIVGYYVIDVFVIKNQSTWSSLVYLGLDVWWILTIWFFYSQSSKNCDVAISIQNFIRLMFILFSIAVVYGSVNISKNDSMDYARVGYIYHVLAMLPMVFLDRNEKVKNIFLIITVCLTIFSFKRGAIIILPLMIIAFYFFNSADDRKKNLLKIFLGIAAIAVVWIAIDKYSGGFLSSRFTRAELSDGSGRSEIWNAALNNISKRNLVQLIFGIRNQDEFDLWIGIHNEWISYLYSNGVIGLILFVAFILTVIIKAIRLVKSKSVLAGAYMALVVYILGVCMVSGFYHVHSTFYVMLFLGYTQGLLSYSEDTIKDIIGSAKL